ncbi:MAG TPA: NADP-dependent oxidoreductase [Tepidisphaeraceae bacterium]|nr:NADP-dependent oxidoreductase [Tepidisphaeraceae bacterium]
MKAIVIHQYGGPEVLKFEDFADPVVKAGEVLVKSTATSVNPIDKLRRSGVMKDIFPIHFPGVIGVDIAGVIQKIGPDVKGWSVGDRVFAYADQAYAELCAVKASSLAKVPDGMELADAAALPLILTTGSQLISEGTGVKAGQTVLVTGAVGSVGRTAMYSAKLRGAKVIAAVKGNQVSEAAALGADAVVSTEDDDAISRLPAVDAVADAVGGPTAERFLAKVKSGGVFATVVSPPRNVKDFPSVKFVFANSHPDPNIIVHLANAVRDGKLKIPISRRFPLKDAAAANAAIEAGLSGKVLLLAQT